MPCIWQGVMDGARYPAKLRAGSVRHCRRFRFCQASSGSARCSGGLTASLTGSNSGQVRVTRLTGGTVKPGTHSTCARRAEVELSRMIIFLPHFACRRCCHAPFNRMAPKSCCEPGIGRGPGYAAPFTVTTRTFRRRRGLGKDWRGANSTVLRSAGLSAQFADWPVPTMLVDRVGRLGIVPRGIGPGGRRAR
jgi:hypothetical protein